METKNYWFAVISANYDNWDDGSYDLDEAEERVRNYAHDGVENLHIVIIDGDDRDPFAVGCMDYYADTDSFDWNSMTDQVLHECFGW